MNPTLMTGIGIVTCALIAYSIAVLAQQPKQILTRRTMTFLTMGIILDISATACMIAGTGNIPFTVHGVLGYSALTAMLADTILTWRHWRSAQQAHPVTFGLKLYTRIAYGWWVIAYIAGGIIAMIELR